MHRETRVGRRPTLCRAAPTHQFNMPRETSAFWPRRALPNKAHVRRLEVQRQEQRSGGGDMGDGYSRLSTAPPRPSEFHGGEISHVRNTPKELNGGVPCTRLTYPGKFVMPANILPRFTVECAEIKHREKRISSAPPPNPIDPPLPWVSFHHCNGCLRLRARVKRTGGTSGDSRTAPQQTFHMPKSRTARQRFGPAERAQTKRSWETGTHIDLLPHVHVTCRGKLATSACWPH